MNRKQRRAAGKKKQTTGELIDQAIARAATLPPAQAVTALLPLAQQHPGNARLAGYIGRAFRQLRNPGEAETWLRKAVRLDPGFAGAWIQLGGTLFELRKFDEALTCGKKAVDLKPEDAHYLNLYGHMHTPLGRFDAALTLYEQARVRAPDMVSVYYNISELKKFTSDDPVFQDLMKIPPQPDPALQVKLDFTRGKAFHDLGDYAAAFRHYEQGNTLHRHLNPWNSEQYTHYIDTLIRLFDAGLIKKFDGVGHPSEKPVFIVGMPRAGTTLVEQILATHPDVTAGDELDFFEKSVGTPQNNQLIDRLTPELLRNIGGTYVEKLDGLAPDTPCVTDKLPFNFLWLGLIRLTLPNAKIIHVRRDPVNTCLSCYRTHFDSGQPWAYDLGEIGKMYRDYARLMSHWKDLFGTHIREVTYETLTTTPEQEIRKLLSACGLNWDAACLSPHKTDRPTTTASLAQVRNPIYKDSVSASKPYTEFLGPLLQELGALV